MLASVRFLTASQIFVLIMLALLVWCRIANPPGTEWLRNRFADPSIESIPSLENSIVHWQSSRIAGQNKLARVLVFGDSSCLMGLVPRLIDKYCCNLGTLAWLGVEGHTLLLERYLESVGCPEVVIYHVTPATLAASDKDLDRIGWLSRFKLWFNAAEPSLADTLMLARAKLQSVLRMWLPGAGPVPSEARRDPYPSDADFVRILSQTNGFFPEHRTVEPVHEWKDKLIVSEHGVSADAQRHLATLFLSAERRNCHLLIVLNPVPATAVDIRLRNSYRRLSYDLQKLARGKAHVSILQPLLNEFPDRLCVNANHLTPEGAEVWSMQIKKHLGKEPLSSEP